MRQRIKLNSSLALIKNNIIIIIIVIIVCPTSFINYIIVHSFCLRQKDFIKNKQVVRFFFLKEVAKTRILINRRILHRANNCIGCTLIPWKPIFLQFYLSLSLLFFRLNFDASLPSVSRRLELLTTTPHEDCYSTPAIGDSLSLLLVLIQSYIPQLYNLTHKFFCF